MVDAQAVDRPVGSQLQHQPVRRLEDLVALLAQRGESVDVEEAPVVDLVAGHTPVRQTVGLGVDQRLQGVEAGALADLAVQLDAQRLDALAQRGRQRRQLGQAPAQPWERAAAPLACGRAGRIVRRQARQRAVPATAAPCAAHRRRAIAASRASAAGRTASGRAAGGARNSRWRTHPGRRRSPGAARRARARCRTGRPGSAAAPCRAAPGRARPSRCRSARHRPKPGRFRARRATRRCRCRARPCGWARCRPAGPCRAHAAARPAGRSRRACPAPGSARHGRRRRSRAGCRGVRAAAATRTGG